MNGSIVSGTDRIRLTQRPDQRQVCARLRRSMYHEDSGWGTGEVMRDFFIAVLVVRPCGLGLSHHSFCTSSEEPPLSIFNSYWDIPIGRVG